MRTLRAKRRGVSHEVVPSLYDLPRPPRVLGWSAQLRIWKWFAWFKSYITVGRGRDLFNYFSVRRECLRWSAERWVLRYQPPTPTRPHDMTVQTPSVGIRTHSTPGRRRATQTGRWKRKIEKNKSTTGDVRNTDKRRRKINENWTMMRRLFMSILITHEYSLGWLLMIWIITKLEYSWYE